MALPSILHHFDLRITHADTGVEASVALKVARHPSETIERLWLRVLAYAWQWQEGVAFGPGLCEPDAPDVLAMQPDGRAALVVRVGKPEPQRIERDVSGNAGAKVAVLFESPRRLDAFVAEARERRLGRLARAELAAVDPALLAWLSGHDDRRAKVGLTFVADHVYADWAGVGRGPSAGYQNP
jgi:uncharacterized protein YaeQ